MVCIPGSGSVLSGTVRATGVFFGLLGTRGVVGWYVGMYGVVCGLGSSGCGGGRRGPGLYLISLL